MRPTKAEIWARKLLGKPPKVTPPAAPASVSEPRPAPVVKDLSPRTRVIHGDLFDVLPTLEAESIDACVCDPPYELTFMGKRWDASGVAFQVDTWQQVYRVLKPGAHLLAAGIGRTHHRMMVAIEDAGFEIRDCVYHLFGSGFPKSLDVSKAIDATLQLGGSSPELLRQRDGRDFIGGTNKHGHRSGANDVADNTAALLATDAAKQWAGYGTALKPAAEVWVLARKPLIGTIAQNVLQHGTGALNIDACRIQTTDSLGGGAEKAETVCSTNHEGWDRPWKHDDTARAAHAERVRSNVERAEILGRWPANVLLDPEAAALLDAQSGETEEVPRVLYRNGARQMDGWGMAAQSEGIVHGGSGGASRFFYCPKPSRDERDAGCYPLPAKTAGETSNRVDGSAGLNSPRAGAGRLSPLRNYHPTVKPLELMRWLVRLITPPGGTVIDPFMGSGTTGMACRYEQRSFIGVEREAEYVAIAERRIADCLPLLD